MDEGQVAKLEALTAKYANGGSPAAYVNTATQMVGQVGTLFHKLIGCTYVRVPVYCFVSFCFYVIFHGAFFRSRVFEGASCVVTTD